MAEASPSEGWLTARKMPRIDSIHRHHASVFGKVKASSPNAFKPALLVSPIQASSNVLSVRLTRNREGPSHPGSSSHLSENEQREIIHVNNL